jgi:phosphate starvation-inducible PhoH-like protein
MKGKNNTPVTRVAKSDTNRDTSLLRPLNERQAEYIKSIKTSPITIAIGVWGSSKTYIPSVMAADMLLAKEIDKIIICRPAEGKGKSVGFLKGGKDEKLEPWCAPITDTLKQRLGLGNFQAFVDNGKIEMFALEHVKGRSWDNAFIIVDEAEDLEPKVAKSLVGRQGINSKIVITGDLNQQDLKEDSGLEYLLDVARVNNLKVPVIDFDSWEHCVRSEEAKMWGIAFEQYEKYRKAPLQKPVALVK